MTGGLMQLVGKGAQDHLVIGNPSFTHFRNMYKRHTDFAMEHFHLTWKTTNLAIPVNNNLTLRARVERFAQLLHDCYLSVDLPNIFSGFYPGTTNPYEFQWIPNVGYNMLDHVSILVNGQEIVRHTGEWMKLYSALTYQGNKVQVLDHLVGNLPEVFDPSNSFGRTNSYPHSISSATDLAEPSIQGRTLTIPLHFWFCENVGAALPLIALQHSEVEIVVEFTNMFNMFTVLDQTGKRIAPNSTEHPMSLFLSPPLNDNSGPSNPSLTIWSTNSFIEANYIFLTETEMAHIAKTDHSFLINQIDLTTVEGQYGPSNDLLLNIKNLCTRIVWVAQRSDRALVNDVDNYTNWENPNIRPFQAGVPYSSGIALAANISQRDILLQSNIVIDGKDRFTAKNTEFFSNIQNYRHNTGRSIVDFPGLYSYSFALENSTTQPSGHINASMFNKIILRNSYIHPPVVSGNNLLAPTSVCVLKSTVNNPRPTVVNPNALGPNGKPIYTPNDVVRLITKSDANTLAYTYTVRAYVESYNYLRVIGGVANVVFSS